MNKEKIMELAKKAGIARWHINLERHVVDFGIEKFASIVEQATLERAAKVANKFVGCEEIASEIRALANEQPKEMK